MKLNQLFVIGLPLLVVIGIMTGCVDKAKLSGSLSEAPVAMNLEEGEKYESSNKPVNTTFQGSMNVLPLMLELTKGLPYDVVAVGKEAAIEAVQVDGSQLALFDGLLDEAQGLTEIIAYAGITLIVNPKSGLEDITSEEVRAFFSGETTSVQGQTFTMVLPEKTLTSRTLFETFFSLRGDVNGMQKSLIPDTAIKVESDAAVISEVVNNPSGIGVILSGNIDARVKGLRFEGIEATSLAFEEGTYKASIPVVLMAQASNEEMFHTFIKLASSEQGQEAIKKMGFTTTN